MSLRHKSNDYNLSRFFINLLSLLYQTCRFVLFFIAFKSFKLSIQDFFILFKLPVFKFYCILSFIIFLFIYSYFDIVICFLLDIFNVLYVFDVNFLLTFHFVKLLIIG